MPVLAKTIYYITLSASDSKIDVNMCSSHIIYICTERERLDGFDYAWE